MPKLWTRCWYTATVLLLITAMDAGVTRAADNGPSFSTTSRREIVDLPPAPVVPRSTADLQAIQTRVEAVVREALPATVAILLDDAQGSGVIVSRDGYVLTAGHVSGTPGQSVTVVLANGRELKAKALGANNGIDSGMVKILEMPKEGLPFVPVGTTKTLKSGQWVVALGHPGGYRSERPPVVRLGRVLLANRMMIGTDCPLINGDSGGPLFDLDGRLIGINSRIGAATTMNVHVPIDTFTQTWDRLAKGDEWGGATGFLAHHQPRDDSAAEGVLLGINGKDEDRGSGAVINQVKAGTPAEKAGLREGDVVVKFEGKAVAGIDALADAVNTHQPGDVVTLEVLRGGKPVVLRVTLGAMK